MRKLKLFVWHDSLADYSSGVIFALAHNEEEARKAVLDNGGRSLASVEQELKAAPTVYEKPFGHFVFGGG